MSKNALILHGTDGSPEGNWFPWLKNQLLWRGFQVSVPQLPEAHHPSLDRYWAALQDYPFDENTVIVGHSSGASMAFACLHKLVPIVRVHRVVSVAGFSWDEGWNCEDLFSEPYDWEKIKRQTAYTDLLWSRDDPYISREQTQALADHLGVEPMVFEEHGHFNLETGVRFRQFPEVLDLILGQ